ncbi:MAG: metal-dependent hydrolase [Planctomycetota bacterium]|jgi:inner membrane protein|nr:metal-dependent hydrolase [Planctomycetota bacterium]
MDPLTHAMAGQMLADALPFARRLGGKAPMAAALIAMAPDLDLLPAILAGFPPVHNGRFWELFDRGLARRFHRGYTHSFFFAALASLPLGVLAWRWSGRRGRWLHWSLLALLALYSHIVLDIVNPYGTRAWLPFSGARVAWGLLPLFNPSIMIMMGAVLLANHVFRDIHADPEKPPSGGWRGRLASFTGRWPDGGKIAWIGLGLVTARLLATAWLGIWGF